jgi:hypothetical protein
MSEAVMVTLTIHYVDGSEDRFAFPRQGQSYDVVSRFEQVGQKNLLLLDVGDRLIAVPLSSIKSIEVSPPPEKLPPYAVRNVRVAT